MELVLRPEFQQEGLVVAEGVHLQPTPALEAFGQDSGDLPTQGCSRLAQVLLIEQQGQEVRHNYLN
jgi:hypothetical protein